LNIKATFLQQQFYFEHQLQEDGIFSNLPLAFNIKGPFSFNALEKAVNQIIEQHEILRTYFSYQNGELTQHILSHYTTSIKVYDVHPNQIIQTLENAVSKKFDVETVPPAEYSLYQIDDNTVVFLAVFHHMLADFTSLSTFCRQLGEIYGVLVGHNSSGQKIPPSQFSDYAKWEESFMHSVESEKMLDYWEKELQGQREYIQLQKDSNDASGIAIKGSCDNHILTNAESETVSEYSAAQKVNDFVVLLSAYLLTLYYFSGENSIVVGIPLTNRLNVNDDNTMGCFANMSPLRFHINQAENIGKLIQHVRRQLLFAHRNQKVSFNQIVKRVNPPRRFGQNPLYQVGFTLRKPYPFTLEIQNCTTEFIEVQANSSLLDIYCMVGMDDNAIKFRFEYNEALYSSSFMKSFKKTYFNALKMVMSGPEKKITPLVSKNYLESEKIVKKSNLSKSPSDETSEHIHGFVIVSSFTGDHLVAPLRFWAEQMSVNASFDSVINFQVFQQLLNVGSEFLRNMGGSSILLIRIEDWLKYPWPQSEQDDVKFIDSLNRETEKFIKALMSAVDNASTQIILCLCHPSPEVTNSPARSKSIKSLEHRIVEACNAIGTIHTITPDDIEKHYNVENYHNEITLEQAQIPYHNHYYALLSAMIAQKLFQRLFPPYKVVAVDADNTLWRGSIVEDGIDSIVLDESFLQFQSFLVDLHSRGFLLCLVSKNEETDILEAFKYHDSMPLKSDHIVLKKVNWDQKSKNIRQISKELDLGLDSFIFIDDNPMECAEVMMNCPEVLTIQMKDESGFVERLTNHLWAVDSGKVSVEDQQRTRQYLQNIDRKKLLKNTPSYAVFIKGLDLRVMIHHVDFKNYSRISQMTYRINQFRTKPGRLSEQHVKGLIDNNTTELYAINASDRYGDYGTIGVLQLDKMDNELRLSQMLLSCRVLGKGVEHQMVAFAGRKSREYGFSLCTVEFVEMARNKPARIFLEHIGKDFRKDEEDVSIYRFPAEVAANIEFNPAEYEIGDTIFKDEPRQVPTDYSKLVKIRNVFVKKVFESFYSAEEIYKAVGGTSGESSPRNNKEFFQAGKVADLEREMVEIWKIVLQKETINSSENFFDSGGYSILIPQIITMFHERTGYLLDILNIFTYPSIHSLMKHIGSEQPLSEKSDSASNVDRARKRAEKLSSHRRNQRDQRKYE